MNDNDKTLPHDSNTSALASARRLGAVDGAGLTEPGHCIQACMELLEEHRARGVLALDPWAAAYCSSCCEACAERSSQVPSLELDHGTVVQRVDCRHREP
ncbi:MAG: hypothetical protein OEZ06_22035 [Myxococcales bacterium]|nr:hypothetical protein [Myxococcales bacterium]